MELDGWTHILGLPEIFQEQVIPVWEQTELKISPELPSPLLSLTNFFCLFVC